MQGLLSGVTLVLYQPQDVVNVAAAIRAMSNFGLADLRLIEPAAFDPYRIEGIAHHTVSLVAGVRRFSSVEEATADCGLLLGTAGRPPRRDRRTLSARSAAPLLLQAGHMESDHHPKSAVIFGREQDGLPNQVLEHCHGILTIPTHPQNRSLNLAQAVLVVAYELWMATQNTSPEAGDSLTYADPSVSAIGLAGPKQREEMFAALDRLLRTLYPRTTEVRLNASLRRLRTMLMRAAPNAEEAMALTNLCQHASRVLQPGNP